MKLAIAGKGGSGKSTIAGALALSQARAGRRVLALDADPDANLASALGVPVDEQRRIVPISEQRALIEERGFDLVDYNEIRAQYLDRLTNPDWEVPSAPDAEPVM